MIDSSDEEDDTAGSVACAIGNAIAPAGYTIVDDCPPLATELEKNNMIGKTVLYGWDSKNATGWFVGTVQPIGIAQPIGHRSQEDADGELCDQVHGVQDDRWCAQR